MIVRKRTQKFIPYMNPVDFYGKAQMVAKRFCKEHPEADKQVVYMAASEAASRYEASGRLRTKWEFWKWVYVIIKNEIYKTERMRRMAEKKYTYLKSEDKEDIARRYNNGESAGALMEQYGVSYSTLKRILKAGTEAKKEQSEIVSEFQTADEDLVEEPKHSLPLHTQEAKAEPKEEEQPADINAVDVLGNMMGFINMYYNSKENYRLIAAQADEKKAAIAFGINGRVYRMVFKEEE